MSIPELKTIENFLGKHEKCPKCGSRHIHIVAQTVLIKRMSLKGKAFMFEHGKHKYRMSDRNKAGMYDEAKEVQGVVYFCERCPWHSDFYFN